MPSLSAATAAVASDPGAAAPYGYSRRPAAAMLMPLVATVFVAGKTARLTARPDRIKPL